MAQPKSFAVFETVERQDRSKMLDISFVTALNLPDNIDIKNGSILAFSFFVILYSPSSSKGILYWGR
jgi:hypothetical protein